MGIEQHHAVIAVTSDQDSFVMVSTWAEKQPGNFFTSRDLLMNGKKCIMMFPDGGKDRGKYSNLIDELREAFLLKLTGHWTYVTASFGELGTHITDYTRELT